MQFRIAEAFSGVEREAWKRFLIAVAGLAFAFGAALFSSAFRREGDVIATAIAASVALIAAGFIGLYTVPYLAQRVAIARVRDAFNYDLTTEGLVYMGVTLVVAIAALNTGNNLLFIVVAAMIAAVLVSGIASALVLRGLRAELALPAHLFSRQRVLARLRLHNEYHLPSYSISVMPPRPRKYKKYRWEKGIFAFPKNRPPHRQWIRIGDLQLRAAPPPLAEDAILRDTIYFPYIPAKETALAEVELYFRRRGRFVQEGFGLATRFPFSFLLKTRTVALEQDVVVYPSVEPTDEMLDILPLISGEFERHVRGRGYDLYRIREHLPEDSARHVDWKATAKSGSLKVREFTREDERRLRIIFDNPPAGMVTERDYESAVELAASLAWHFAAQGTELSFAAPGYSGSPDLFDFLGYLALVQPQSRSGEETSVFDRLPAGDGQYNLVLSAKPQGSLPTEQWSCSYVIFMQGAAKSQNAMQAEAE